MKIRFSKVVSTAFVVMITAYAFAQNPVKWSYSTKKISSTQYQIQLTAFIEDGWHLYSQTQPETAIALPTRISFFRSPMIDLKGSIQEEGKLQKVKEETLKIEAWQYSKKVSFVQLVELKRQVKTNVTGTIEFQTCTDEKCLPPATINFNIELEP